ncbi:hypothetical protein C8Q74DRAFT_401310 [Fomes fomentarius]|nr:hypothetical protein C8Q74DRAFT_401310 [Fomes fomentarius]
MARSPALHFTSSHPSHALALALLLLFLQLASCPSTVYTYLLRFVLRLWSPHTTPHHPMCIIGIHPCIRAYLSSRRCSISSLPHSRTFSYANNYKYCYRYCCFPVRSLPLSLSHPG